MSIDRIIATTLLLATPLLVGGALIATKGPHPLGAEITRADCAGVTPAPAPEVFAVQNAADVEGATLVLYDSTGTSAPKFEVAGTLTANLARQAGRVVSSPVQRYQAGWMNAASTTIYMGANDGEQLPATFLADVAATTRSVIWIASNIEQLSRYMETQAAGSFAARSGFQLVGDRTSERPASNVRYRDIMFVRTEQPRLLWWEVSLAGGTSLAEILPDDGGSPAPWAVEKDTFTYIVEVPYAHTSEVDRYVAFAAILQRKLRPDAPERRRAVVRIEDVSPGTDPMALRNTLSGLIGEKIPFAVHVIPLYRDPAKDISDNRELRLTDRPTLVKELKYAVENGGELIFHGYTHQYSRQPNPYSGVTAADFEFYLAHIDDQDNVVLDGPPPEETTDWWSACRIKLGLAAIEGVGLPQPKLFTVPHYAAGVNTYRAASTAFAGRFERGLYPAGLLSGEKFDYRFASGQYYPYPVTDVLGGKIVPENLGNRIPVGFNNNPSRSVEDIVDAARHNLVVQDSVVGFFWHAWLGGDKRVGEFELRDTVRQIKLLGYEFVKPSSVAEG